MRGRGRQLDYLMSPHTLRRTYMPKRQHPAPAPKAAAPQPQSQAQPPAAHLKIKTKTTRFTIGNRSPGISMFPEDNSKRKKFTGQGWETEVLCAKAFLRPPCMYMGDIPFYPYFHNVIVPKVNFALNYKF